MNPKEKILYALDELYSSAEFVHEMCKEARRHIEHGRPSRAMEMLKKSESHAGLVRMLHDDAQAAIPDALK